MGSGVWVTETEATLQAIIERKEKDLGHAKQKLKEMQTKLEEAESTQLSERQRIRLLLDHADVAVGQTHAAIVAGHKSLKARISDFCRIVESQPAAKS